MTVEFRRMRLRSARSFRVWFLHGWWVQTPAVGPMLGFRVCGWAIHIYPDLQS